jgi:uncharacterized protein
VVVAAIAIAGAFVLTRGHDLRIPPALADLPVESVHVGELELTVVLAADPERGLMGVGELGDLDGMLFAYDTPVDPARTGVWMKDVRIPLDVAFFDPDGRLIQVIGMPLCTADPCPIYVASRPYSWAIETRAGSVTYPDGATLRRG